MRCSSTALRSLLSTLLLGACATGAGSTASIAPFPGEAAVNARVKELNEKATIVGACLAGHSETGGGTFEISADSSGKLSGRTVLWRGAPATETCVLEAIKGASVSPLSGPPVSTLWTFQPTGAKAPPPPNLATLDEHEVATIQARLGATEISACAQRHLPPEFGADVAVGFFVFAGGRVAAPNLASSTSSDGDFDFCVMRAVAGTTFPDPHYDGPFPLKLRWHVGKLDKM